VGLRSLPLRRLCVQFFAQPAALPIQRFELNPVAFELACALSHLGVKGLDLAVSRSKPALDLFDLLGLIFKSAAGTFQFNREICQLLSLPRQLVLIGIRLLERAGLLVFFLYNRTVERLYFVLRKVQLDDDLGHLPLENPKLR
jgi:hypothetical protein